MNSNTNQYIEWPWNTPSTCDRPHGTYWPYPLSNCSTFVAPISEYWPIKIRKIENGFIVNQDGKEFFAESKEKILEIIK